MSSTDRQNRLLVAEDWKRIYQSYRNADFKSYDFDDNGNETKIDYAKMMDIVKQYNYDGFIGVEYEGGRLGEKEGILATKNLIERFL